MPAGDWEELIRDALLEIGAKEAGEALDADEKADGFRVLVDMLDQWGIEGLIKPGLTTLAHTVSVQKAEFTVGPAGQDPAVDIVSPKPVEVVYALNYQAIGMQQRRPLKETAFQPLSETRNLLSTVRPRKYFIDRAHPNARILFDSLPLLDDRFWLTFRGHFGDIAIDDQTSTTLPTGYRNAVKLNLAVWLAPQHGARAAGSGLSPKTERRAREALSAITRRNIGSMKSKLPGALRRYGNNLLRTYRRNY